MDDLKDLITRSLSGISGFTVVTNAGETVLTIPPVAGKDYFDPEYDPRWIRHRWTPREIVFKEGHEFAVILPGGITCRGAASCHSTWEEAEASAEMLAGMGVPCTVIDREGNCYRDYITCAMLEPDETFAERADPVIAERQRIAKYLHDCAEGWLENSEKTKKRNPPQHFTSADLESEVGIQFESAARKIYQGNYTP